MTFSPEENFRRNMRLLREDLNLTQLQLAEILIEQGHAFHQQTIQKIERGDRSVKLAEGLAIAQALDMPLDDLLKDTALVGLDQVLLDLSERESSLVASMNDYEREQLRLATMADALGEDLEAPDGVREAITRTVEDVNRHRAKINQFKVQEFGQFMDHLDISVPDRRHGPFQRLFEEAVRGQHPEAS